MAVGNLRYVSFTIALAVFWLVLSGHYTVLLICLGIVSVLATVALAHRMAIVDSEGHPIQLLPASLTYWPWLIWEIAKSSVSVARLIVDPRMPISPTMVRVKAGQKSPLGVNIYANSITLTPGTISVEVERDEILVHAITRSGAAELELGAMDKRVSAFEGKS